MKRFLSKVNKGLKGACWIWTAARFHDGYGMFRYSGKICRAHRVSWMLFKGPIPAGMFICHRCDNPLCVNPDHLFFGSPGDNCRDMERKGRSTHPRGEQNGRSKLSEIQVKEIRHKHKNDNISQRQLSKIYGVSRPVISAILKREYWKHV